MAVDLPAALLIGSGVAEGDLVWVLSRIVGATSLVEVVTAELVAELGYRRRVLR